MSNQQTFGTGGGSPIVLPLEPTEGGTGLDTYNTGDILYASAPDTLARLAAPSIPGSALVYSGSQPVWSSISNTMTMQDDFVSSSSMGSLGWGNIVGGGGSFDGAPAVSTSAHPGVWLLRTNGAFSSASVQQANSFTFGGGAFTIEWIARLPALSNGTDRFEIQIGTGDVFNGSPTQNGLYFSYQDNVNSGNWVGNAVNGGAGSVLNSSIAADTNWHRFTIQVNAAGTSAQFLIDGVSLGAAIATNIPTTNLTAFHIQMVNQGASTADRDLWVDAFQCYQQLTAAR